MEKPLGKKVIYLAAPVIAANILLTFQMIADTIMLGRYSPAEVSITSVGLGNTLYFLFFPLIMGLGTGSIAIIARRWGEENYDEACKTATDAVSTLLMISVPIAIVGFVFGPDIIVFLGAEDRVVTEGAKYVRTIFTFYSFSVFGVAYQSMLFAAGDTKTPLLVNFIANIYNVFMNYCLIFGNFGFPELGVLGAGIGTGTSYLVAVLIIVLLQMSNKLIIHPDFKSAIKIRFTTVRKIFSIGIPAGIDMGMWAISAFIATPLILHFGKIGYSAFQVGLRAEGIAYMPAIGFGVAATALAGQYLGAKNEDLARTAVVTATKYVIVLMSVAGAILVLFPRQIAVVFTNDKDIVEIAIYYLFLMGFSEPFLGMVFTLAGGMRGAGYTRVPMYVNFLSLIVVRLLLIYFLAFALSLGIKGIWYAIVLETVIRALSLYAVFLKGSWMKVKV